MLLQTWPPAGSYMHQSSVGTLPKKCLLAAYTYSAHTKTVDRSHVRKADVGYPLRCCTIARYLFCTQDWWFVAQIREACGWRSSCGAASSTHLEKHSTFFFQRPKFRRQHSHLSTINACTTQHLATSVPLKRSTSLTAGSLFIAVNHH